MLSQKSISHFVSQSNNYVRKTVIQSHSHYQFVSHMWQLYTVAQSQNLEQLQSSGN
jgi:hypothetical protein